METPPPLRHRLPWQTLLVEVFSVMLAVLLALGVNAWWQARQDAALADAAHDNFVRELRTNAETLHRNVEYYERMSDLMTGYYRQNTFTSIEDMMDQARADGFRGFSPPFLRDAAWETAVAAQVMQHMPYRHTFALSTAYKFQERLTGYADGYMMSMLNPTVLDSENLDVALMNASIYFGDIGGMARNLYDVYNEALEVLDAEPYVPPSDSTAAP